jgi:hypothetical protein
MIGSSSARKDVCQSVPCCYRSYPPVPGKRLHKFIPEPTGLFHVIMMAIIDMD